MEAPAENETDPARTFGQDTVTAINHCSSGNRVVGVPDVHCGATLILAPPALGGFRLEGGVTGARRYFADDANAVAVPGYTLLNATLAFDDLASAASASACEDFLR